MQISISNTFKISVGEHEIILSVFDAEKLYQELGRSLGKNSTPSTLYRGSPIVAEPDLSERTPLPYNDHLTHPYKNIRMHSNGNKS